MECNECQGVGTWYEEFEEGTETRIKCERCNGTGYID